MAYFLVMGGLALTVCFTFGWAVWWILRWAFVRLGRRSSSGGRKSAARASKGKKAAAKVPAKASSREKGRSAVPRAAATAEKGPARRDKAAEPSPPWKLTVALAPLSGAWPLAVLLVALYGGGRLAAHGMMARPQHAPDAFRGLVEALGWGAVALLGVALLGLLATWRCRRHG